MALHQPLPPGCDWHVIAQVNAAADRSSWWDIAEEVEGTPRAWFDGIDPSVAFALLWFGHAGANSPAASVFEPACWLGYRHVRLLLGRDAHPVICDPSRADLLGEVIAKAAMSSAARDVRQELGPDVACCHRRLAADLVEQAVSASLGEQRQPSGDLVPVTLLALEIGLLVGLVEERAVLATI